MRERRTVDLYAFPGFRPRACVVGVFGDPRARVVRLERRGNTPAAGHAVGVRGASTSGSIDGCGICRQEKRAGMIERHRDGIAAYCRPENKVSLGFVEGRNNKIPVIQRRAYGLRDEEYLRLKILTCMLPEI